MRIGIDAVPLRRQRTGIGNYIYGLLEWLPQVAPQNEYFVYSNRRVNLPPAFIASQEQTPQERIDSRFRWCPGTIWLLCRCSNLIRKDTIDVFWATAAVLPPSLPPGILKIVTVYDLVWLRYPETTTSYNLLIQKMCARKAIAQADLILTISRTTQDELIETLAVPRSKTRVVYPVISERYKSQNPKDAAEYISNKYAVPARYMATLGTVEPRKNVAVLVRALRILKENGALNCPLLVAGANGWRNSNLFREIQASGLTQDDIRFLGYLPDEDLPFFYSGAQIFLFPSLYEGFGLPPVEAMACGAPVIASNAPCMPEVLGDAAILESPTCPQRFAAAITKVLQDENLRRSMRERGILRAGKFCSRASAQHLLEVFEERRCSAIHV
jgi:glycosyltransferase involved in cell wall biosynthesis